MPGFTVTETKGFPTMALFFLGADVSKGYADFAILDEHRKPVLKTFELCGPCKA